MKAGEDFCKAVNHGRPGKAEIERGILQVS